MRPVPIPDDVIWAGSERKVFAAPDGDLTSDEIRPVEAIVDFPNNPQVPVISVMCALEDGDLVKLAEGGHVWVSFYGHLVPFSVDTSAATAAPAISGPEVMPALVDEIRDAFGQVALAGWKARDMNVSDQRMLELLAGQVEPMVQSIMRKVVTA